MYRIDNLAREPEFSCLLIIAHIQLQSYDFQKYLLHTNHVVKR